MQTGTVIAAPHETRRAHAAPHYTPRVHAEPREMTVRAVAVGFGVGLVLTAAIAYLALYSGLAISATIPAAMLCTGIMRMARRRVTILENSVAQTIASSGEAVCLGAAFTLPALVLTGVRHDLGYWEVSLATALGGLLGVLFTIPLRRALTRASPELRYPESVAALKISEAGDKGGRSLLPAVLAAGCGAAFKTMVSVFQVITGTVEGAVRVGGTILYGGMDISLAVLGVGVFVGLEVAGPMVLGGAISWLVAIPLVTDSAATARADLVAVVWQSWSSEVRFIGIGAMIVGGCASIVKARRAIGHGVRNAVQGLQRQGTDRLERTEEDLPTRWVAIAVALAAVLTFLFLRTVTGSTGLGLAATTLILVLVFAFTAVSAHIVGLVGNSNNPVSGLAISALVITSIVFVLFGVRANSQVIIVVLLIAAFICCATAAAGDTAQHLKTGAMVKATPRRLQVAQLLGVGAFAFVVAPIIMLLQKGFGIGTGGSGALKAPQAVMFANLTDTIFRSGRLPVPMLWIGAAIALTAIAVDTTLRGSGRRVGLQVMPLAIGLYLPLSLTVPLFLGALFKHVLQRLNRHNGTAFSEAVHGRSVLLWSGLITGEAIIGVCTAALRYFGVDVPVRVLASSAVSLLTLGLVLGFIYHFSHPPGSHQARWGWRRGGSRSA